MIFHITDVLPTMIYLIVNSPIAILPNQPLTKRAFIADLTWLNQSPQSMSPLLTLRVREGEQ